MELFGHLVPGGQIISYPQLFMSYMQTTSKGRPPVDDGSSLLSVSRSIGSKGQRSNRPPAAENSSLRPHPSPRAWRHAPTIETYIRIGLSVRLLGAQHPFTQVISRTAHPSYGLRVPTHNGGIPWFLRVPARPNQPGWDFPCRFELRSFGSGDANASSHLLFLTSVSVLQSHITDHLLLPPSRVGAA